MYLGIDLGTSGIKVILADSSQTIVTSATAALQVSRPHSGWSEQNPDDWIAATRHAFAEIRKVYASELKAVSAVGLSGQMHGATVLDNKDKVLRPCILWNDTRSHQEASELDAMPVFREVTGNIVFPGFTAPKLRWLQKHETDLFDQIEKVLLPKDYLRHWLTGDYISDMSDASGTGWLDVASRKWSPALLQICKLDEKQMPALVEGSEAAGQIRPDVAKELGLGGNVIVAGGGGDNATSAIATGIIEPGSAFISIGTSGVIFAANDEFLPNPDSAVHTFCHALPDRWHQMGVILSASASLNWYSGITGCSEKMLTTELGGTLRPPSEVLFLPYLAGERTPHNDAKVRGSFLGLGAEMDRGALTQSILEGVAFAFRDNLEALRSTGTTPASVIALGGGMNSPYWVKVIASVLDLPVEIPQHREFGAAFGAVRLAMLADGLASAEKVCQAPMLSDTVFPDQSLRPQFEASYQRFRAAYQHTAPTV